MSAVCEPTCSMRHLAGAEDGQNGPPQHLEDGALCHLQFARRNTCCSFPPVGRDRLQLTRSSEF